MRKSFLAIALCAAVLCGCAGGGYNISGSWSEGEGKVVYLYEGTSNEDLTLLDSTVVSGGTFAFKGKVDMMTPARLTAGEQYESFLLYDYDEPLKVNITGETRPSKKNADSLVVFNRITIEDMPFDQKIYKDGKENSTNYSLVNLVKMIAVSKFLDGELPMPQDSMEFAIAEFDRKNLESLNAYLDTAKTSRAATFLIADHVVRNWSYDKADSSYNILSDAVKASAEGKRLRETLDRASQCVIGGTPDDFTLQTPDGADFNLYSLRGHYVIIDFWASWCGPCRAEMPNVKSIYADYHDKGLEILGVSLDDDAAKWTDAIAKLELPWHHVSALKGWDCPVAAKFNVTGIPRMFILDPDGKIIDMDLRGDDLRTRIAGLYAE